MFQPSPGDFEILEENDIHILCETKGCWAYATRAKYHKASKLLTWVCPNGHEGHVEDFELYE